MNPRKAVALLFIFSCAAAIGCVKKANPPVAGTGGTATLILLAQHHGISINIDTLSLYIKYNAMDAPSTKIYDDSTNCICANGVVTCTFTNLKNGNYYIATRHGDDSTRGALKSGEEDITITQQNTTTTTTMLVSE